MGLGSKWFSLDTPATPERIRMACLDEFTSPFVKQMESEGVSLPLIHEHPMKPWNDLRKGDCCQRFVSQSDGYYCKTCDFFLHKECGELTEFIIDHPAHPDHTLRLQGIRGHVCDICERKIKNLCYRCCDGCDFDMDLHCAKYPPPDVIDNFETHSHKLTLVKKNTVFDCSAKCGKAYGLSYKCEECDVAFPVECVWHPEASELNYSPEVNHSYHSLHPLKFLTGEPPEYSDGKCRLYGTEIGKLFYHCSSCNFTVGFHCVLNPPQKSLVDPKVHDHQLTLLPRLDSFTCNACGLKGDRSPYACFDCGFMIHQDCLGLPRVININRHDHRVSRTSVLGDAAMNSVCGVCRKKVDWTYGGFSCKRCPGYVVHSKCATRKDVWNGKELEGIPEEEEDIEPYVVIDENTIQHFSHKEHYLRRIHGNGVWYEENKRCSACIHLIGLQSFYGCVDCDFYLHHKCAECPKMKRHVLHNDRLTLVTNEELEVFNCLVCDRASSGFMYKDGNRKLDVLCGSVSEPFFHPSHPHHPLYYIPTEEEEICNGCNRREHHMLRCIEGDCGFVLGFKCATLPQVVKHIVDDHPLSLCYGQEEEASGKYWCDICEKETNPKEWFYTCKNQQASLHTMCVLGDCTGLMPRSVAKLWGKPTEVMLNNSVTRPFCIWCMSRCMYPIKLKLLGTSGTYACSLECAFYFIIILIELDSSLPLSFDLPNAGALVHVYTVLVTHGGVEMGQGLHTKVAQVAASAFSIPLNSVFVSETSTDKVIDFLRTERTITVKQCITSVVTHISPSFVLFAIKDAIKAARAEVGLGRKWFPLVTPATPERIRIACFDEFTSPFVSLDFCPKLSV
ncbi:unnamed protein product [Brassica rapa]|uniref:Phorbol-ester/DAG-type domain-containing protein n=1 Tax=Brassica campestris TaxID=3711 RepID=A0A8D9CNG0_BRACM|nr:unnamed protein product [Brassica rapa]